jgi:hypothetical protein
LFYSGKTNIQPNVIIHTPEKSSSISIKFNRPIPRNETNELTVNIQQSGKINFDGATHVQEVYEMYYWINYILNIAFNEVTFDYRVDYAEISSSSEDYQPIYDDTYVPSDDSE